MMDVDGEKWSSLYTASTTAQSTESFQSNFKINVHLTVKLYMLKQVQISPWNIYRETETGPYTDGRIEV